MLPSAGVVLEHPLLNGVALDRETGSLVAAAYQLSVDLPLTVASLEAEGPGDTRSVNSVRELVKSKRRPEYLPDSRKNY